MRSIMTRWRSTSTLTVVLLFLLPCCSFRVFSVISRVNQPWSRLFASDTPESSVSESSFTRATPISESILPTYYESDLYEVLKVPLNSTRLQLRDAFWKIAYNTHPDRNNTPEALSLFRNASYAYKILGRDEKTRAEYDAKYRTLMYIDVASQLGRDVFKPLAMEVAMPLINMTMRGISRLAVPFFKDAYEQSSAVYQATFDETNDDDEATGSYSVLDVFERAAGAAARKSMEQRIRRTKEGIESTANRLEATSTQMFEADDEEQLLRSSIVELKAIAAKDQGILDTITTEANNARTQWESAQLVEKQRAEEYARSEASVAALLETAASLALTRNQEEEEVRRLEGALLQAKERVRETIIKQTGLEISVSFENKTRESLATNYALATDITNSTLSVYKELEAGRLNLSTSTARLLKDLQDAVTDVEKSTAMREYLERRVQQLITKKATLENTLIELQDEYIVKHAKKLSKQKLLLMDGMTASEGVIAAVAKITGETTLLSGDGVSTGIEDKTIIQDNPDKADGNNKEDDGKEKKKKGFFGRLRRGDASDDNDTISSEIDGVDPNI